MVCCAGMKGRVCYLVPQIGYGCELDSKDVGLEDVGW